MTNKQFLCENFFLFKDVSEKTVSVLLQNEGVFEKAFSPGETMQCNTSKTLGIIVKGKAIVKSGEDGVIIKKLNKNDVYGAAALFDEPNYITVVKAVSDCISLTFTEEFIEKAIAFDSTIAKNYIRFLSERISFLNSKINAYTAKSAENKLYTYFLQLPREGNIINLSVDMSTIAKMIGIGRATLYRALEKLEQNGTILKKDKQIILTEA